LRRFIDSGIGYGELRTASQRAHEWHGGVRDSVAISHPKFLAHGKMVGKSATKNEFGGHFKNKIIEVLL